MEKSKLWYKSDSLRGNIVVVVSLVVSWTGLPVLKDEVTAVVGAIFALIGVGYAIYGRIKTKGEPIGWAVK